MTRRIPWAVAGETELRDLRSVSVAEIDAGGEDDGGDEEADIGEDGVGDGGLAGVDAEGEHDDDAAGAGGDGEGEGIEGLFAQTVDLLLVMAGTAASVFSGLGVLSFWLSRDQPIMAMTMPPANCMMGNRDTEEGEDGGADEFDDGEEDDGVDGDPAGEGSGRCRWARCRRDRERRARSREG